MHDVVTIDNYLLTRIAYPKYPRVTVSQLNLISLNKVTVEYTDTQRAANKDALLNIVRAIEAENFETRLGAHCAWCAMRPHLILSRHQKRATNVVALLHIVYSMRAANHD